MNQDNDLSTVYHWKGSGTQSYVERTEDDPALWRQLEDERLSLVAEVEGACSHIGDADNLDALLAKTERIAELCRTLGYFNYENPQPEQAQRLMCIIRTEDRTRADSRRRARQDMDRRVERAIADATELAAIIERLNEAPAAGDLLPPIGSASTTTPDRRELADRIASLTKRRERIESAGKALRYAPKATRDHVVGLFDTLIMRLDKGIEDAREGIAAIDAEREAERVRSESTEPADLLRRIEALEGARV